MMDLDSIDNYLDNLDQQIDQQINSVMDSALKGLSDASSLDLDVGIRWSAYVGVLSFSAAAALILSDVRRRLANHQGLHLRAPSLGPTLRLPLTQIASPLLVVRQLFL